MQGAVLDCQAPLGGVASRGVILVTNHLFQVSLVVSSWENGEQGCQHHSGKPTDSDNNLVEGQTHCLLLGTILKMLNC